VSGQAPTEAEAEEQFQRFADDVLAARMRLVDGTPEKYPAAMAKVRILDAEFVISKVLAQRDVVDAQTRTLELVCRTALYGPGPGTTAEQALATIATFVEKRLAAVVSGIPEKP
jgi:hypothetical protein